MAKRITQGISFSNEDEYNIISAAAALVGGGFSAFVRAAALREAEGILANQGRTRLDPRAFVASFKEAK